MITTYLALFFSEKKLNILSSFIILGLAGLVRYESVLLIIPTSVIFLHRYFNDDFRKFITGVLKLRTPLSLYGSGYDSEIFVKVNTDPRKFSDIV